MALKQAPRVWTGYMNFSPDLVSSDFAEPRAQSLGQQEASRIQRSKIGAQNTRKLQSASRSAPSARRFTLAKTDDRRVEETIEKKERLANYKEKLQVAERKYLAAKYKLEKPSNK